MRRMGIGLQMYTLRNEMEADLESTLRKIAALGYEGVEFAGYFGWEAEKLFKLLQELKLQAIGSHIGMERLRSHLQEEIDYLKTIGASYIVCPYIPEKERAQEADWKALFSFFEQTGKACARQGIIFAYHNHSFEFDLSVEGLFAFDALYDATSPAAVKVEMDVCWVQFAGQDPLVYIQKYNTRLPLLHLKDFNKDAAGRIITLELGKGIVQLDAVIAASQDAGVQWLIVEQDVCQIPPLESVANSLNWVKDHYCC